VALPPRPLNPPNSTPLAVKIGSQDFAKSVRKRKARAAAQHRTYSIYIIELSRACSKQPCALAPLYVGQTAHTPEHRFAQHKAGGILAAPKVHKFGIKLRLDLMKGIGPMSTRRAAEAMEKMVAEALTRTGHRVFWG